MLCDMEFCSKRVGRSKDKRLYLYGSGDNGHYVCMKLTLLAGIGMVLTLIDYFCRSISWKGIGLKMDLQNEKCVK